MPVLGSYPAMNERVRIIHSGAARQSSLAASPIRRLRCFSDQKYWQEQRWQICGDEMHGYYRTFRGSYQGAIKLFQSGDHRYFIVNPPQQLRQHPHWPCFVYQGRDDLYWVHFNLKPRNVDAGIITIETILRESLERYV